VPAVVRFPDHAFNESLTPDRESPNDQHRQKGVGVRGAAEACKIVTDLIRNDAAASLETIR
jgi:hypothetical protein